MYQHLEKIKTPKEKYLISIIIPVFNEDKTIYSILKKLPYNDFIEIIVIDDYSLDNSIFEIKKAQKERKETVIFLSKKKKVYK